MPGQGQALLRYSINHNVWTIASVLRIIDTVQHPKAKQYKKIATKILLSILVILVLFFIYIYVVLQPRNDRVWETGFEKLPHFTIKNDTVTIHNLRNYTYAPKKIVSFGYKDRTINLNAIEKVWFIVEPFGEHPGIAHTYFVFDIKNADPIAISVEARREKGETYDAFLGLINQFELIYVWGTETDETIGRVMIWDDKLYMYPTTLSKPWAKALFLQLAKDSQKLETTPRFYNSLLSNCTNELAKTANTIKPGAIPLNIALFLPAFAPQELYKLGFIPHDRPLEEITKHSYISDLVKKLYTEVDFSKKLRDSLK